jgi:hypothetical protein
MELYTSSPIRLHGVVLNELIARPSLLLPLPKENSVIQKRLTNILIDLEIQPSIPQQL